MRWASLLPSDFIRTSTCDKHSASMKFITHLDHMSYCRTESGGARLEKAARAVSKAAEGISFPAGASRAKKHGRNRAPQKNKDKSKDRLKAARLEKSTRAVSKAAESIGLTRLEKAAKEGGRDTAKERERGTDKFGGENEL